MYLKHFPKQKGLAVLTVEAQTVCDMLLLMTMFMYALSVPFLAMMMIWNMLGFKLMPMITAFRV